MEFYFRWSRALDAGPLGTTGPRFSLNLTLPGGEAGFFLDGAISHRAKMQRLSKEKKALDVGRFFWVEPFAPLKKSGFVSIFQCPDGSFRTKALRRYGPYNVCEPCHLKGSFDYRLKRTKQTGSGRADARTAGWPMQGLRESMLGFRGYMPSTMALRRHERAHAQSRRGRAGADRVTDVNPKEAHRKEEPTKGLRGPCLRSIMPGVSRLLTGPRLLIAS